MKVYENIEIEFKSKVTQELYYELLERFNLENNVFKQTNYYFDTPDLKLNKDKVVLRIRQKGENYKVTLKSQSEFGAHENHVLLTKEKALDMIENGFKIKDFFDDYDYDVTLRASLVNYRAKTFYPGGSLFIDKCEYCGLIDYEIEFEVDNYEEGYKAWIELLKENNVTLTPTRRKSERALTCSSKK